MKNCIKKMLVAFLVMSTLSISAMDRPSAWTQNIVNWWRTFTASQPKPLPEGFETLPKELQRSIIEDTVLAAPSLDQASEQLKALSLTKKSINDLVNEEKFTETLINKLHAKFGNRWPWRSENKVVIALALGTSGSKEWLKNMIRKNADMHNEAEHEIEQTIRNNDASQKVANEGKAKFLIDVIGSKSTVDFKSTALSLAVRQQKPAIIKMLLSVGANPNYICHPSIYAEERGPFDIANTALDDAMETGNQEIIDLIKRAGGKSKEELLGRILIRSMLPSCRIS